MLKLSLSLIMAIFTNNAYSCVMEYKQDINTDGIMDSICLLEPENKDKSDYLVKVCLSNDRCFFNSKILEEIDLPPSSELSSLISSSDAENGFIIQTQDFQITILYIKSNLLVTKIIGSSRERPTVFIHKKPSTFRAIKVVFMEVNFEKFDFKKYKIDLIPDKNDTNKIINFKKKDLKSDSTNDLLNLIYMGGIHDKTIDNVDLILEYLQTRDDVEVDSIRDLIFQKKSLYPNRKSKSNIVNKAFLYKHPKENKKTKMYLIKGDKVTLLDEKTDDTGQKWYFINYKGKKDLNMWIKAETVNIESPQQVEPTKPKKAEPAPQTKVETPKPAVVKTEQKTSTPKKAEIVIAKEETTKTKSGSSSFPLLVSLLGLLAWRANA
ncbi:hypothetical protein [Sulfurimonas sp.]